MREDTPSIDPRIRVEGPDDRDPDEAEDYPPGHDWALYCDQPDLEDLLGRRVSTHDVERRVDRGLPRDVRRRLEWDSESGMLAVYGTEQDIRLVADALHRLREN